MSEHPQEPSKIFDYSGHFSASHLLPPGHHRVLAGLCPPPLAPEGSVQGTGSRRRLVAAE